MKRKIFSLVSIFLVVLTSLSLSSCSSDDDGSSQNELIGKWYLYSYDGGECTWGEYWQISSDQIKWNNRMGGENTTYSYTKSGNTLRMKCTYSSENNVSDYQESTAVYSISDGVLAVVVDDGLTRIFYKK
jgi:hypothetical protein